MVAHFAGLGEEAIAGLVISGVASTLFFFRYIWQIYIDSNRCAKHAKLCRSSKKLLACAAVGSFAIFVSYMAMYFEQGFYLRSDGILVFWARYVAYAVATSSLLKIVSHLVWANKQTRAVSGKFAAAFWVVAGVFGTLSPANYNWFYFGAAFAPLVAALGTLFLTSRREDKIAKGKLLWVSLGLAAFALVWILSPAGLNDIDIEEAQLGFLILEPLVFFACFWLGVCYFIPQKKAVIVANKGKGRLTKPFRTLTRCPKCASGNEYSSNSGSSSGSDSSSSDDQGHY